MKTFNRLGTFDDILSDTNKHVAELCLSLRDLIISLHPDCVEVPRAGDRAISYGFGEKKMSEAYAYIMPQKTYVNLGFYHGVEFENDHPSMEGTGKRLRHIKIRSLETVQSTELKKVLIISMNERKTSLNLSE